MTLPNVTKFRTLRALAKFAGGTDPNLHKGLEKNGSGYDRDHGDVHDRGDDRGSVREQHHYQLLPAGTCTSHNSSAPVPVESQFLALVAQRATGAESPFLANRSWKFLDIAPAAGR